jgi:hypothetical protein
VNGEMIEMHMGAWGGILVNWASLSP